MRLILFVLAMLISWPLAASGSPREATCGVRLISPEAVATEDQPIPPPGGSFADQVTGIDPLSPEDLRVVVPVHRAEDRVFAGWWILLPDVDYEVASSGDLLETYAGLIETRFDFAIDRLDSGDLRLTYRLWATDQQHEIHGIRLPFSVTVGGFRAELAAIRSPGEAQLMLTCAAAPSAAAGGPVSETPP